MLYKRSKAIMFYNRKIIHTIIHHSRKKSSYYPKDFHIRSYERCYKFDVP